MLQERHSTLVFRKFSETLADSFHTFYHPSNDVIYVRIKTNEQKNATNINFGFSVQERHLGQSRMTLRDALTGWGWAVGAGAAVGEAAAEVPSSRTGSPASGVHQLHGDHTFRKELQ